MRYLVTFLVGLVAGICAVFVPRLASLLVIDDLARVTIFPAPFILLGLVFALIIGLVAMILEHGKQRPLGDVFVTALGIPAVIAASVANSGATGQIQSVRQQYANVVREAATAEKINKDDNATSVQLLIEKPTPSPRGELEMLLGIQTAFAGDEPPNKTSKDKSALTGSTGVLFHEPEYAIVIHSASNQEDAIKRAAELKKSVPSSQAVKLGDTFRVISGIKPENAATLEAVRLKREFGLNPELVRVERK
jgi:hypothetical protein